MRTPKARTNPLLARALARTRKNHKVVTDDEIGVALAWMRGQITLAQLSAAYDPSREASGNALYRAATCLREAYRLGLLKDSAAA